MSKPIRIGIPRALFFYDYYPLYKKFFEELGCKVIVSPKTDKKILEDGLKISTNELCLPIKVLYGHVLALKDKVDYIFLPYLISTQKGSYICPKLIGSPDLVKANINVKLLTLDVDMNFKYFSMIKAFTDIAVQINYNPIRIINAYNKAVVEQEKFNKKIKKGIFFEEAISNACIKKKNKPKMKIAVIGHTYVFNDGYISSNLIEKLTKLNISVVTSDMLSYSQIRKILDTSGRKTHWNLGNRVLASAIYYSKSNDVDGIIYITPFGCSSDSLVKEFIEASISNKPFMTLTVDEHSGDAGIITRLEAFIDMIERGKKK